MADCVRARPQRAHAKVITFPRNQRARELYPDPGCKIPIFVPESGPSRKFPKDFGKVMKRRSEARLSNYMRNLRATRASSLFQFFSGILVHTAPRFGTAGPPGPAQYLYMFLLINVLCFQSTALLGQLVTAVLSMINACFY